MPDKNDETMFYMCMFYKCILLTYLGTQSRVYGGAIFAKIVDDFYLITIFAKKLRVSSK